MPDQSEQSTERQRRGAIGVLVRDDGRLLVIERSQFVRAPGRFCFPGGGIEEGESEEAAVRRELIEELNLQVDPLRRLWQSETRSGIQLNWWLVQLSPAHQEPRPNLREVARCYWMERFEITRRRETLSSNRKFLAAVETGEIDFSH